MPNGFRPLLKDLALIGLGFADKDGNRGSRRWPSQNMPRNLQRREIHGPQRQRL